MFNFWPRTNKTGELKDKEYTLIDIGIAAEHFCLQAAELGLGACMIGWFDEKKVGQLLGVPKNKRIRQQAIWIIHLEIQRFYPSFITQPR